jgi:hypothetical protein
MKISPLATITMGATSRSSRNIQLLLVVVDVHETIGWTNQNAQEEGGDVQEMLHTLGRILRQDGKDSVVLLHMLHRNSDIPETQFSGFRARAENGLLTKMTRTPKSVYPFSTTRKSCPHAT